MFSHFPYHRPTFKSLLIVLVLLLASCGKGSANKLHPSSNNQSPASTTSVSSNLQINDLIPNKGAVIDSAGLHIQSANGFQCDENLVFATDRLTYDSGELQQMGEYVNAHYNSQTLPTLPSAFKWLSGSKFGSCGLDLQITNIGTNTLQIPKAGVRFTHNSYRNTYHYRLIETCSFVKDCQARGGNPTTCAQFLASIQIGVTTNAGSNFFNDVKAYSRDQQPCSPLTLAPGQTAELIIVVQSPLPIPGTIYPSLIPELILSSSNGTHTLNLSQFIGTFVSADQSQFTCYALKGNTFVPETGDNFQSLGLTVSICI